MIILKYFLQTLLNTEMPIEFLTSPRRADLNFLTHFTGRVDHQYFNGQLLACEVQTGMCEVLTKSGLSWLK